MAEVDLDALEGLLAASKKTEWLYRPADAALIVALHFEASALLAELRRARELERGVGALRDRLDHCIEFESGSELRLNEYVINELRARLPAADGALEAPAAAPPAPTDGPATERALRLAVEALQAAESALAACWDRLSQSDWNEDAPSTFEAENALLKTTQALAACRATLAGKEAGDG